MRTDKNKGKRTIARLLDRLERDLCAVEVSLDAYANSNHPERGEALRWHRPLLEEARQALVVASDRIKPQK